jgi:hypothetical protein
VADPRTTEEIAGGFIRARVGGTTRDLPTLKIAAAREWRLRLVEALGSVSPSMLSLDLDALKGDGIAAMTGLAPLAQMTSDRILDLVVAYDPSAALGGRDWLEEHADDAELYALLRVILGVVFPFVTDLRSGLAQLMVLWQSAARTNPDLGRSIVSSFTSGLPATTPSALPPSKKPSTKRSS